MRLWVVSTSYPTKPGESVNAGVVARDLALALRDRGHALTVVTPRKPDPTVFDQGLTGVELAWFRPSVAMADLKLRRPVDALRAATLLADGYRRVRRQARRAPPDGIIAVWGLPSGLLARAASSVSGAPYCVWLLGSDVWRAPDLPGGVAALRWALAGARATFANSHDLVERAQALTGSVVGYLPAARRLPEGERRPPSTDLAYVGRLHPNKGPDVLVDALSVLARRGSAPLTRMYGTGEMDAPIGARIRDCDLQGSVTIEGPIDAAPLAEMLRSSRFLVIPSRIDSTPIVLGDAIQARVPVIVTDVGDTGALVRRFDLGWVVPPGDPVALADALAEALAGPGFRGDRLPDWEGAAELISPDTAVGRFLEVLAD
ncbi:N/A [soil metagenome]